MNKSLQLFTSLDSAGIQFHVVESTNGNSHYHPSTMLTWDDIAYRLLDSPGVMDAISERVMKKMYGRIT